jgi:hypothetical protein
LLLKICAIATLLLASSGCAITLKSVTNRFDSPEASGGLGKGHVDPIAVAGGGGESGTDSDSGFSSITANYNLSYSAWDAALIAGYRPLDWMLIYGGPFHSQVSYSGTLTQSGGTQATYALSGRLEQTGGNLGIMGNFNHFALQLEWAFANCQNASGGAIDAQTVGVNGRFYW